MEPTEKIRAISDSLAFNPLVARDWLNVGGVVGVWLILFAETGLLLGFFLPGDTLLFLAGIAASDAGRSIVGGQSLSLPWLLIGTPIAAIAGAQVGHYLGARVGPSLFNRPDSRLFKRAHVEKAEYYFAKFGPAKAVVAARFIPIVRTFLNPVAGVLEMPARTFFVWNVVGGILWTDGIITAGYLLGGRLSATFPIERYILLTMVVVVGGSVLGPLLIESIRRGRRAKKRADINS